MKKKVLALVLAAMMLVSLTACSASSSTTSSFSTTINGETTTTTTTTTVGTEGVSKETVTTTESEYNRSDVWHEMFAEGAEGQGEDGALYYLAVDDFSDMDQAAFMMMGASEADDIYIMGHFEDSDDGLLLVDDYDEGEHYIRMWVTDTEVEDGFELEFADGERIEFHFVDQDVIIDDMLAYVHD